MAKRKPHRVKAHTRKVGSKLKNVRGHRRGFKS